MTSTATDFAPQELRTTGGGVFAYFVPAAEMDRMRAEIEALREQVARLEKQRDHFAVEVTRMVQKYIPRPMTEEELAEAIKNPSDLGDLIAELESR